MNKIKFCYLIVYSILFRKKSRHRCARVNFDQSFKSPVSDSSPQPVRWIFQTLSIGRHQWTQLSGHVSIQAACFRKRAKGAQGEGEDRAGPFVLWRIRRWWMSYTWRSPVLHLSRIVAEPSFTFDTRFDPGLFCLYFIMEIVKTF